MIVNCLNNWKKRVVIYEIKKIVIRELEGENNEFSFGRFKVEMFVRYLGVRY